MNIKTFQIFSTDHSWLLHDSLAMDVSVKNLIVCANEIVKWQIRGSKASRKRVRIEKKERLKRLRTSNFHLKIPYNNKTSIY